MWFTPGAPKSQVLFANKRNSYSIIPEYKFFVFRKRKYAGYYIGVYGKYIHEYGKTTKVFLNSNSNINIYEYTDSSIGGGIINGFQLYFFKHLAVDFLFGVGVNEVIKFKQLQGFTEENYSPQFDYRLALNIGYKF